MEFPWAEEKIIEHSNLLADSYYFWTKKELIAPDLDEKDIAFLMYHASYIIVSYGKETDPIFNYANSKAQQLWKMDWDKFIQTTSRLFAEPIEADEKHLKQAEKNGFISDFSGVRISSQGEEVRIKDTFLWNIVDDKGIYHGQAALFSLWENL